MFDPQLVLTLARRHPSFYLYQEEGILQQARQLIRDFPGVEFLYSVKANPHPGVLGCLFPLGIGADAASLAEVRRSSTMGLPRDRIFYSAPGKRLEDLERALEACTIIADSPGEVQRIQQLAQHRGIVAEIGLRINPDFTFAEAGGAPSKFGIDEDQVLAQLDQWKGLDHLRIGGIHVHLRSQELCAPVLGRYHQQVLQLAVRVQEALRQALQFINLGSGLGIPYTQQEQPLDTRALGQAFQGYLAPLREQFPHTRILLESGRYLVGQSGIFVTTVVDKKVSHDRTYVMLDRTLNGFLRPSLARLVLQYAEGPSPAPTEPLFTTGQPCQILPLTRETVQETVTLVGNLCTSADEIARDITLPRLRCGDVLVLTNAGSYGASLTPVQFSSHTPPPEFFVTCSGAVLPPAGDLQVQL